jgi:hypothetical protein
LLFNIFAATPYLEAVSSIRNLSTRRAVVKKGPPKMVLEERKVWRVLVGKPEGKRPLGRPRRRWKDGIRIGLREAGWGLWSGFSWPKIRDRWRALANTVMNLRR